MRQAVSLTATAAFVLLAFGSMPSEDDMARYEAERAERAVELDAYRATMAKVYLTHQSLDVHEMLPIDCDGAALKANSKRLHVAYHPFMRRFAEPDKLAYQDMGGDLEWITDATWKAHFKEHDEDRTVLAIDSTAKTILSTFLDQRYMLVVVPDVKEENVMPVNGADSYDGGFLKAAVIIVDQTDGSTVCADVIEVESSDEIEWQEGGRGLNAINNEESQDALNADFQDNFEKEIREFVPSELSITSSYGHLLR